MKNLKQLLGICEHKWIQIDKVNVVEDNYSTPHAFEYHLKCEKCGIIKKKRV
jgi:hypothetical protein